MTILHAFFAEGNSEGDCMLEIIDSLLDLLGNLEHVILFTITELTEGSVDDLSAAVLLSHLEIGGVK